MQEPEGPKRNVNRGRRADEIVGRCRERLERGEIVDPEEVIREHPDLAAVLRPRLAALALLASSSRGPSTAAATVGPYHVLRELGRGAQGTVYLAEDTRLPRRVALKVFSPGFLPSARTLGRVRREAETASRLDHPGICTVYEAQFEGATPYIAMRHVDGRTLLDWIEETRAKSKDRARTTEVDLPTPSHASAPDGVLRVVALIEKVARALHAAHEAGVVHRDVKPGNVLVTSSGEPVLVDFGLAQEDEGGRTLTATGALVGTPAYMSPEQLLGTEVRLDARTDVYSLGVTLYECLTLKLPFEAPTRDALYRQILSSSTDSPRRSNPHVPRDLEVVVETAMQKSRERRYATSLEFAEDLRRLRMDEPIRARATPPLVRIGRMARRHPALTTGIVAAFALLVTGLAITAHFLEKSREEQRRTEKALDERTKASEHARSLALVGASALATPVDGVRAVLLAREAVRAESSVATFDQLRKAVHHSLERVELVGHKGRLGAAAVSPRGDRVVTACDDMTACIWELSGRRVAVLTGRGTIHVAEFSPDGGRIATASSDKTAQIWDASGNLLMVLRGHSAKLVAVAFSPQGDRVVTGSDDKTARVWNLADGSSVVLAGHTKGVRSACFSPSGDRILTASDDATARVWSSDGKQLAVLSGHKSFLQTARFSPHGDKIVTASRDGTARVWNVDGRPLAVLRGHRTYVTGATFSPSGDRIATTSADLTARLWDLSGVELCAPMRHNATAWRPEFSPAGDRFVTSSNDGTARIWDLSGRLVAQMCGHGDQTVAATFTPRGDRVVTASYDGTARVWDVAEKELAVMAGHEGPVWSAAYSPQGDRIVTASDDRTARVWSLDGEKIATLAGHSDRVNSAAFSRAGNRIVTTSYDWSARVWDADGKPLFVLPGHKDGVGGAAFSPDGERIVTACFDGKARIFDATGRLLFTCLGHTSHVASCAFSPDGGRFVTGSRDRTARVWDVSGAPLATLSGHENSVGAVAWSPRGDLIATASGDRTARLWTPDGRQLVVLRGHDNVVHSVEFSPDGDSVLTSSEDGTARLWNLRGEELAEFSAFGSAFDGAAFSPKGDRIVTASTDGTARTWFARDEDLLALAAERCTRELTLRERERYADILGPDNADAIEAYRVVERVGDASILVSEQVERIDADVSIGAGARAAAHRLLARGVDDPRALNKAAWEVVKAPGRSDDEYRAALRRLEAAAAIAPGYSVALDSLGAAQYRLGRFDGALATFEISDAVGSKAKPAGFVEDVAFLAMCHRRLGHAEESRRCLDRLRGMPAPAPGSDAALLVAEAEATCAQ